MSPSRPSWRDPQLERGVEELMKLLPPTPGALPHRPAPPNKSQAQ